MNFMAASKQAKQEARRSFVFEEAAKRGSIKMEENIFMLSLRIANCDKIAEILLICHFPPAPLLFVCSNNIEFLLSCRIIEQEIIGDHIIQKLNRMERELKYQQHGMLFRYY